MAGCDLVEISEGSQSGWSCTPCQRAVALQLYRDGSADFADGLHIALAAQAGELPLWTFDRQAARLRDAARVEG